MVSTKACQKTGSGRKEGGGGGGERRGAGRRGGGSRGRNFECCIV